MKTFIVIHVAAILLCSTSFGAILPAPSIFDPRNGGAPTQEEIIKTCNVMIMLHKLGCIKEVERLVKIKKLKTEESFTEKMVCDGEAGMFAHSVIECKQNGY